MYISIFCLGNAGYTLLVFNKQKRKRHLEIGMDFLPCTLLILLCNMSKVCLVGDDNDDTLSHSYISEHNDAHWCEIVVAEIEKKEQLCDEL